jgi:hypothetical protein
MEHKIFENGRRSHDQGHRGDTYWRRENNNILHKSVTMIVWKYKDIHLKNAVQIWSAPFETVSSISTAGEFKPINGAPNLTLTMFGW